MKFSIKDFFSKCDKIRRKVRISSHLLKKSLIRTQSDICDEAKRDINNINWIYIYIYKNLKPQKFEMCVD